MYKSKALCFRGEMFRFAIADNVYLGHCENNYNLPLKSFNSEMVNIQIVHNCTVV